MKKICSLFIIAFMLTNCDDGDVVVDTISLENVTLQKCDVNRLFYKFEANNSLALDLDLENYTKLFSNIVEQKTPIAINNSSVKLIYRTYNGVVTSDNICGTILNPFPSINQQWEAINGFITVTTTMNKSVDETTGATKITGYNHTILFKTIGWSKPDGNLQETQDRPFGKFITYPVNVLPFGFVKTALKPQICSINNSKILLNINNNEALELKLSEISYTNLFPATTAVGTRTALLSTENMLTYKLFEGFVTPTYFCTFPTPDLPQENEKWSFVYNPNTTPSTIEVQTSLLGTTEVTHKVILKNVTLEQGTSNFYLGNEYELGSFVAPRN